MFKLTDVKLDMIRVYLEKRVPDCEIEDLYQDEKQGMHVFQLKCRGRTTTIHVSRIFVDEHSPAEILATIIRRRLESYFRGMMTGLIVITTDEIKIKA